MHIGFGEATSRSKPFPYKIWKQNFLPEDEYDEIEKLLYAHVFDEESLLNKGEDVYPFGQTHMCPGLNGFRDRWHLKEHKAWLAEQLDWPEDVPMYIQVTVHVDSKGFYQDLHRDLKDEQSPEAYGTLQIYFGSEEKSHTGAWVGETKEDQIPFERNTAWCFKASDVSWHSVDKISHTIDRRSIMINVCSQDNRGPVYNEETDYGEPQEIVTTPLHTGTFRDHRKIDFCITTYCQSKCPTCPRTDAETLELANFISLQHMPFPVWKDVIDKIDWSKKTIQFCGEHGDPMMHPEIEKFILAGTERAWQVMINTNGGIRKAQWYRDIYDKVEDQDYGDLSFVFAIDGLTQETNEKYRIDVDFERAWENFETCVDIASRLTQWDYLVFEHNWHEIDDVIRIAREMEVSVDIKVNKGGYQLLTNPEGIQHVSQVLDIPIEDLQPYAS